jgi:hypothetical protein
MSNPHLRLWPPLCPFVCPGIVRIRSTARSSSFVGGRLRLWAVASVCGRSSSFVGGGLRLWAVVFVCEWSALS